MSYQIGRNGVRFSGRKVAGAMPDGFVMLDDRLGWDDNSVFVDGRVHQADRRSARYVDPWYFADGQTVFHLAQRGSKPVSKADPASFRSLGNGYGADAKMVYYLGKRVVGARPSSAISLADRVLVDQRFVYIEGQKEVSLAEVSGRISRVLGDRGRLALIIDSAVWWHDSEAGKLKLIDGADPATYELIEGRLFRDARRLYLGPDAIEGFNLATLHRLPPRGWTDGKLIVISDRLISDGDPATCVHAFDAWYTDSHRLYYHGEADAPVALVRGDVGVLVNTVAARLFGLYDMGLPYNDELDSELRDGNPEPIVARLRGGQLELTGYGITVLGEVAGLDDLISRLWTQARFGRPFRRYLHKSGWYPNPVREMLRVAGVEWAAVARAEFEAGHPESAALVFTWLQHGGYLPRAGLAALGPLAIGAAAVELQRPTGSTNLAVARRWVACGALAAKEARQRLDALCELYGLTAETDQDLNFLDTVMPAVANLAQNDPSATVRDTALAVIDLAVGRFFLDRDVYRQVRQQALPLVRLLVAKEFNLDANLLRLFECALVAEDAAAAADAELRLNKLMNDRPVPGRWGGLHLHRYPNVEFAIVFTLLEYQLYMGIRLPAERCRALVERVGAWRGVLGYREALQSYQEIVYLLDRVAAEPFLDVVEADTTHTRWHAVQEAAHKARYVPHGLALIDSGCYAPSRKWWHSEDRPDWIPHDLVAAGNSFTVQLGDRIGLRFMPDGFPWGRIVEAEITVTHPLIGGRMVTCYQKVPTALGIANDFFWVFETAAELQSGSWSISVEIAQFEPLQVNFHLAA